MAPQTPSTDVLNRVQISSASLELIKAVRHCWPSNPIAINPQIRTKRKEVYPKSNAVAESQVSNVAKLDLKWDWKPVGGSVNQMRFSMSCSHLVFQSKYKPILSTTQC